MRSALFEEFLADLLQKEGGFVDHPADSGGATNYGITIKVARSYGYFGDMRALPKSMAAQIYFEKYWVALSLDEIEKFSPTIAAKLSEIAVNCGVFRSSEFIQRYLNVMNNGGKLYPDIKIDGDIGSQTVATLKKYLNIRKVEGELVLIRGLNCLQGEHYIRLAERREKDEAFVYGQLLNRVV